MKANPIKRRPKKAGTSAESNPSRLSAIQVVDLLWPRLAAPGEKRRDVDSRIRAWLKYSIQEGKIISAGSVSTGLSGKTFNRDEILRCARETWPRQLAGMATVTEVAGSVGRASDGLVAFEIPSSPDRCQQALREALDENYRLRARLASALMELEGCQSDAAKWRQANMKKGRRGVQDT